MIIIPLLTILFLALSYYGVETGNPLCSFDGCSVALSLFENAEHMYILGILALIVLIALFKYRNLYISYLHILIICETIFLSYLYFRTGAFCFSCLIFYGFLILNLIYVLKDNMLALFIKMTYVIAIIIAFFILDIKREFKLPEGHTLITSPTCKYCSELKLELKTFYNEIDYKLLEDIFKELGLTTVPVYFIKDKNGIQIIEGKDNILREVNEDLIFVNPFNEILPPSGCAVKEGC